MELQDQPTATSEWLFAAGYSEKYNSLPPSQQREAMKRLTTRRRNPLSADQCRETNPDIEAVLEAVYNAYNNKKLRSKAGSATRRATVAAACVQLESETSARAEPDTGAEVEIVCVEPDAEVEIVCALEPEIEQATAPEQPPKVEQPVQPPEVVHSVKRVQPVQPRSRPVPIPRPVADAAKKAPPAASGGLAGMLRGRAR